LGSSGGLLFLGESGRGVLTGGSVFSGTTGSVTEGAAGVSEGSDGAAVAAGGGAGALPLLRPFSDPSLFFPYKT